MKPPYIRTRSVEGRRYVFATAVGFNNDGMIASHPLYDNFLVDMSSWRSMMMDLCRHLYKPGIYAVQFGFTELFKHDD